MTQKPFKFRYTNEITGAFVLGAVILVIVGVLVSGQVKGWFEGKFTLRVVFTTDEGAFGLKEGNEVLIRDSAAGRVGKIFPNENGDLETTLVLQDRYRRFVREDSVATVKKKLVMAGDAYVEIKVGTGGTVDDGFLIPCGKDEELTEKATKLLTNVQEAIVPVLDEVKGILKNVNGILGSIERGEGVAGAIVKDQDLANGVEDSVESLNGALVEVKGTLRETTTLIKGVQRHWLLRKYVDQGRKASEIYLPAAMGGAALKTTSEEEALALVESRAANDSAAIARGALNLGVCMLLKGDVKAAGRLVDEVRLEAPARSAEHIRSSLLEAEVLLARGATNEALRVAGFAAGEADKGGDVDLRIQAHLVAARCNAVAGRTDEVATEAALLGKLADKTDSAVLEGMAGALAGQALLLAGRHEEAAASLDEASRILQGGGDYHRMAQALSLAGTAYEAAGRAGQAADRYFRAARSLAAEGTSPEARKAARAGLSAAQNAGDKTVAEQAEALILELGPDQDAGGNAGS